ncbi:MAG: DJ-1/PfpI family protein [Paracoccaceae bacterium]
MARTIGIVIFDGAEEMDFVGPWEVLTAAAEGAPGDRVALIAETRDPVTCEKGMRVLPGATYDEIPALDVIVLPGGSGARREIGNPATVDWLQRVAPGCTWITSVCTGAFLLLGAGLAKGRRITTHHAFLGDLRAMGGATVLEGRRFVRDGNVVSAGGVMSGIEMSLWLVRDLYGPEAEADTRSYIAYDHPPRDAVAGG